MFDEQKYLNFISSKEFEDVTDTVYYSFFNSLKFIDSSVREEEADFIAWDSSLHYDEQIYMKFKEAFYQKNKYRCKHHFYFGMSLFPKSTISQAENHKVIRDDLLAGAEYEKLLLDIVNEQNKAKKATGTDKKYIDEWSERYSCRSDAYAKAFIMAGYFTAKRQAEMISNVQNLVTEIPD